MKADACTPVNATLAVIGGKWKPAVIHHLTDNPMRFNELQRHIPDVSQRMLTLQLRELERDGIISRRDFRENPPRVEYALTDFGRTLLPVIHAMHAWGSRYAGQIR